MNFRDSLAKSGRFPNKLYYFNYAEKALHNAEIFG